MLDIHKITTLHPQKAKVLCLSIQQSQPQTTSKKVNVTNNNWTVKKRIESWKNMFIDIPNFFLCVLP